MQEPSVHQSEQQSTRVPLKSAPMAAPMVDRAFQVLDMVAAREAGYRLSELAQALGMSKGSMHGLLKTMLQLGVVELAGDRRYMLGPRIFDLAQAYIRRGGLRGLALPAMRRLSILSGETVLLGQIESDVVRIVEVVEAPAEHAALRVAARRGTRIPLLAGATGRVILASWSADRRADYLRTHALPQFTEHSMTSPHAYLAAVDETVRTDVGEEHEEYLAGVNAVAAGIRGLSGEVIALLWIAGFSDRFCGSVLQRATEALRDEAQTISRALGKR
jgi:IclR family acetate operon transcriptional repressor